MKIGDYVRTDKGTIFKVENITEIDIDGQWFKSKTKENSVIKDLPRFMYNETDEYIIKSSPNIIDLIEVGDYVNGERIDYITNKKELLTNGNYNLLKKYKDISTILTKEQFKSMEYRIGEQI